MSWVAPLLLLLAHGQVTRAGLCLKNGPLLAQAFLANVSLLLPTTNCPLWPPRDYVYISPLSSNVTCLWAPPLADNGSNIDLGAIDPSYCDQNTTVNNTQLCPPNATVFVCGDQAFSFLPTNWTGLCALAWLLPDLNIIPNNQSLPIPAFDHLGGRSKRAIQAIPIMLGLGITAGVATGSAGIGTSLHYYNTLSRQMINDLGAVSENILDLQT